MDELKSMPHSYQSSKVLSLDLLTNEDLEAMRYGDKSVKQHSSELHKFQKLYLILTYAVAFDRYVEVRSLINNDLCNDAS
jgi:hypothetical protein